MPVCYEEPWLAKLDEIRDHIADYLHIFFIVRYIGLYIKCLGMVIYKDIPRFLMVFSTILVAFSTSFYIAVRGMDPELTGTPLVDR